MSMYKLQQSILLLKKHLRLRVWEKTARYKAINLFDFIMFSSRLNLIGGMALIKNKNIKIIFS